MDKRKSKIIVTLGPATNKEKDIEKIKDKDVDFVRINMSHSTLEDLKYFIKISKKIGIPFIIDTEGSQVRTGDIVEDIISFNENDEVVLRSKQIVGNKKELSLRPGSIIEQLKEGDLIHIDFDTLILRVTDTSTVSKGFITTRVITSGFIGRNKAVVIDPVLEKKLHLPPLSEKDHKSIELGLKEGIEYIAVSFVRSGETVDEVKKITRNKMKVISKIECMDALENIDEIIEKSDFLLIDRGDLSKEIPVEKIPFTQKIIINKAKKQDTGVFVATNLLETMVEKRKPTRAEVHDVINTIADGAYGLTLASETAIGKYPMECINMLEKLITHSEFIVKNKLKSQKNVLIENLEKSNYLLENNISSSLIPPHGSKLVNRVLSIEPSKKELNSLKKIKLDVNKQMDVEQIAIGTYSPIEGFMGEDDFNSVLNTMRLKSGVIWPIPIILDVSKATADKFSIGEKIALTDNNDEIIGILDLSEKYTFNKQETAQKLYETTSEDHPGVRTINKMNPILIAGKIDLIKKRDSKTKAYELTPKQVRRLFDERGWSKVLGFHTRNVIHRGHEFIQLKAMEDENCDGLLVHPIIGQKKPGDFNQEYIIKSYEKMIDSFYPKNKVVFSTFATFSRYAGPREALFTAICRKNFGCSHFVVGRDHTGVGNFYDPEASHKIFDKFPDIEIKPVKFGEVYYSKKLNDYVHDFNCSSMGNVDKLTISGSYARKMVEQGEMPPKWLMRPEISKILLDAVKTGEEIFVKEEKN